VISLTRYRDDSIWDLRGALAFQLAPVLPPFLYALYSDENFGGVFFIGAVTCYLYTLVFGLPLAYVLNRRRKISLLTTAVGSFLIGALPWALFMTVMKVRSYMLYGLGVALENLAAVFRMIAFFGAFGLAAGLTWWFIACFRRTNPAG